MNTSTTHPAPQLALIVFAWWPVPLSEFRPPYWYPTGKWAWFRRVRKTRTVWWDTFYTEIQK